MMKTVEMHDYQVRQQMHADTYVGFCPLCSNWSLTNISFDAGHGNVFKIIECTECYSHPRHRLLHFYLRGLFDQFDGPVDVLHFAPEFSLSNLIKSYTNTNYLSVDLDGEKAMQKEDITKLTLKDQTFDFILNVHVMEHIPDDQKAYEEMFRVLRPGGAALIDVPMEEMRQVKTYEDFTITDPQERTKHFGQYDHVRMYGRDVLKRMEKAGFIVYPTFLYSSMSFEDKLKFGLYRQFLFLCVRPTQHVPFNVYAHCMFKSLPNHGALHVSGPRIAYIADISGTFETVAGKKSTFEVEYIIDAPKKLLVGIGEGIYSHEFFYTDYVDLLPGKRSVRFELPMVEKFLAKDQLYMIVGILHEENGQYQIVDEVSLRLKGVGAHEQVYQFR